MFIVIREEEMAGEWRQTACNFCGVRCGFEMLAEDIKAAIDQPPFPRSPLDGYAVRAADTAGASQDSPALLKVISEVDAGGCCKGQLKSGEAVRIMTGAPVPDDTGAIIAAIDAV